MANFSQNTVLYPVTLSTNPQYGGLTSGQGNFQSGTSVTVTAQALNSYTFSGWKENGNIVSNNPTYTFIINSARNLVAYFDSSNVNAISVFSNPGPGFVNIITADKFQLSVFNSTGQLVLTKQLTIPNNQIKFNAAGIYLLQFTDSNGKKINRRILIAK